MKSVFVVLKFWTFNDVTVCRPLLGFEFSFRQRQEFDVNFSYIFEEFSKKVSKNTNFLRTSYIF
jgi:hypothetical protein